MDLGMGSVIEIYHKDVYTFYKKYSYLTNTRSDNKMRELVTICCGNSGHEPQYVLMTLAYQLFTAALLLTYWYGTLFLSGVYYCLSICILVCRRENAGA
jgi:hypothetical protein